jgi:hypothetical protein
MSPCPGSLWMRCAGHGSPGAGDRLRPWLNTFGPAERGTSHADKSQVKSRAAHTLPLGAKVHGRLHTTSVHAVPAYPPQAPYSRAVRGGASTEARPCAIGHDTSDGRGEHTNFCVLSVGADRTSMSRDVISVQVDLIKDSIKSGQTSR